MPVRAELPELMQYLQSGTELRALADKLSGVTLLAADTEAAGYHRYRDTVCLLQLSTRLETYVIDTLAVADLQVLIPIFAREETEVVFHDADYDLRLLHRDFGINVTSLFDTKIAAQLLGEHAFGLGSLVEKFLQITLEKKHQRADWAQRPLPADMLHYAAEDTRHLPALRDALREELARRGRLHWAEEEFRLSQEARWLAAEDAEPFLRTKGARDLKPRELAVLRELHAWRERAAEERDVATFRVLNNEALLEISRRMPVRVEDLQNIPGLGPGLIDRRGEELLAAVQRAARIEESNLPRFPRLPRRAPPEADFEARVEKLRAVRDRVANQLQLDRGFLMPRQQLEDIARERPRTAEQLSQVKHIRRWQIEALGEALLQALA
jgi:ribonuclease D